MLLADNFHGDDARNPLRGWLIYIRLRAGDSDRRRRAGSLVKLLDALVILMIFLYFFTTLLSVWIVLLSMQKDGRYRRPGPAPREVVETTTETETETETETDEEMGRRRR